MTFTSKEIDNYLNSLQQTLSEINIPIVYGKGKNKELRTSYLTSTKKAAKNFFVF